MSTRKQTTHKDENSELLKNLLIVELAKAGVPQTEIRKIVAVDMARVNKIAKFFKKSRRRGADD